VYRESKENSKGNRIGVLGCAEDDGGEPRLYRVHTFVKDKDEKRSKLELQGEGGFLESQQRINVKGEEGDSDAKGSGGNCQRARDPQKR